MSDAVRCDASRGSCIVTLSPEQRTAAAELLSRGTGMNCFEEAALLLDTLQELMEAHAISAVDVIRWLTMLPRVKDRAGALAQAPMPNPAQLSLVSPVAALPQTMQHAMRPVEGQSRARPTQWLTNPSSAPTRPKRVGRPAEGVCIECGEAFEMNPFGRPATRCATHRRSTPRQETA